MLREKNRFEKGAHWQLSPVGCVKAMWRYATRRASKQKRRLLRFPVTISTVMNLHGSDNRGGIIVKTYKEYLSCFIYLLFFYFVVVSFRHYNLPPQEVPQMAVEHWQCKSGLYFRSIFRIDFFFFNHNFLASPYIQSVRSVKERVAGLLPL